MGWEGQLWYPGHVLVFLSRGHRMGTAASTANLLDDVEGHSCGKKWQMRHTELCVLCWLLPHVIALLEIPIRSMAAGVTGSSLVPCGSPV